MRNQLVGSRLRVRKPWQELVLSDLHSLESEGSKDQAVALVSSPAINFLQAEYRLRQITFKTSRGIRAQNVPDYTVFRASRVTFFPVNRVEHQKLNQPAAEPPPGWVFDVQLGLRQTRVTYQYLTHYHHLASFWDSWKKFKTTFPQTDNFIEYI